MPKALTHSELLAEIAKATRNRNKRALRAQHLLEQGKRDEAREMLARADYWEAERKALERKVKVRKEAKRDPDPPAPDRPSRRARRKT